MKETKENIEILKKLGFEKDQFGYYSNLNGWGFVIDNMPSYVVLLSRLNKSSYNDGYDDSSENKKRKFGIPNDR